MASRHLISSAIAATLGVIAPGAPAGADATRIATPLRLVTDGGDNRQAIRETPLGKTGGEGAGTLERGPGFGRGFGAGMWRGTARRVIMDVLPRLPVALASPVRRSLARRLLLSQAAVPGGTGGFALTGTRLELLYAMGALKDVVRLAKRAGAKDGLARRALLSARMLSGANRPTCAELESLLKAGPGAFAERALIACYALTGQHFRALGALRMMSEQGSNLSRRFRLLVAAQEDPSVARGLNLSRLDALEVVLLASGKLWLPAQVSKIVHPAHLRALALSGGRPVRRRIALAERAFRLGAIDVAEMASAYTALKVRAAVRAAATRLTLKMYRAETRAILYQAAVGAESDAGRLVILATWWRLSQAAGDWRTTAALTLPMIGKLEPAVRWRPYAASIARAYLATGQYQAADPWFDLLHKAPFRDQRAYARLRVLMHLARGAHVRLSRQDLADWVRAQRRRGASPRQALRLYRLVAALGDAGKDQPVWRAITGGAASARPSPAVWRGVRAIARERKIGETVMLTLVQLGERDLKNVPATGLHGAILALLDVGLVREARALAVEAAIASGM